MRVAITTMVGGPDDVQFVVDAERLGADSVWVPEVWGADALTPLAYLAARTERIGLASGIVQLGARTPANLAMTAMSIQQLSGGRFRLGVGTSGPQVMEGWHGVRFTSPIAATRETIEIVRTVARGDKLSYSGRVYQLPLPDGPGRPIRSMLPPTEIPIYVASLGPKNLELTGELADGWLGNAFLPEHAEEFLVHLRAGRRQGRAVAGRARPADAGGGRDHRRPRGGRPPPRPRVRVHDRGDGLAGPELLQRRLRPPGLRRRRRRRAGPVAGRPAGGGGRAGADRAGHEDEPARPARRRSATGCGPTATPASPPSRPSSPARRPSASTPSPSCSTSPPTV